MYKRIALMTNKHLVLTIVLLLFSCSSEADSEVGKSEADYYEYDFTNKEKTEKITLRFRKANVTTFPGWEHDHNRRAMVSLWYPSLLDASSPNVWMKKSEEQKKLNTQPNLEERMFKLKVGVPRNTILDENVTLEEKLPRHCRIKTRKKRLPRRWAS